MNTITAIAFQALGADQARIERVATNLANLQTPGFKREVGGEFALQVDAQALEAQAGPPAAQALAARKASIDLRAGTLRNTGRSLDLAIDGPGYLEVATASGPAYTRRGDLAIDAHGRLVTSQGHAVIGTGGEISLESDRVVIDTSGRLLDGDKAFGQLRLVELEPDSVRSIGAGLFSSSTPPREAELSRTALRQGVLENANVDTAHEMVSMLATVRHFEALLRMEQGRDEMLGQAIRKLGEA